MHRLTAGPAGVRVCLLLVASLALAPTLCCVLGALALGEAAAPAGGAAAVAAPHLPCHLPPPAEAAASAANGDGVSLQACSACDYAIAFERCDPAGNAPALHFDLDHAAVARIDLAVAGGLRPVMLHSSPLRGPPPLQAPTLVDLKVLLLA